MYSNPSSSFMAEEDLLYTILADLKRTVGEYTTATTESNCPAVRQMFTDLTNSTLKLQGELYNLMSQLNMYSTSSPALRQEVQKQLQQSQQSQQKLQQFIQQKLGQSAHHTVPQHLVQGQAGQHQQPPSVYM
ncbi:spore coat protein [Paenibacillus sp. ACRRX]|uniref:spore coat protein n=1 Tax=unclassified Paenibacillus TaxID=185978 RepID=UPI001EF7212B|nr:MULTISPECIES: spore coat protein [unclassified Paenibacillus]MCG7409856.1 spore coat protein [Paenibacillus sp. ACRRX]MDK8183077.1 spore coat protein [Paenibacillus sp. UMB4589-SE434]